MVSFTQFPAPLTLDEAAVLEDENEVADLIESIQIVSNFDTGPFVVTIGLDPAGKDVLIVAGIESPVFVARGT